MPNYSTNPHWNTARKVASRKDSIIEPYRHFFGLCLPPDTQYWTMCGAHYTGEAGQEEGIDGEFGQLVSEGLFLDLSQFHGVDHNPYIITKNRQFYPGVNWHCGDFLTTLTDYFIDNGSDGCHPSIINFDNVREPPRGAHQLTSLIRFIDNNLGHPLMLTANFLMYNPRAGRSWDGMGVFNLISDKLADHWSILPYYYSYIGGAAEQSRSVMGTFIFIKEEHSQVVMTPGRDLAVREALLC